MDITQHGGSSADPMGLSFQVNITSDNMAEIPTQWIEALQDAQSCPEILGVLTVIAIQLDRKRLEFEGALREATAKRDAAAAQRVRRRDERGYVRSGKDRRRGFDRRMHKIIPMKGASMVLRAKADRRQGERRGG